MKLRIENLLSFDTPIQNISRISPAYQKRLARLGIITLRDLFYHFPRRYEDFSNIKNISDLKLGETATVQGKIAQIKTVRTWKKRLVITEAHVQDSTGVIKVVWFNQPYLSDTLKTGNHLSISGKINFNKGLYFSNPSYEKVDKKFEQKTAQLRHTGRLVPIYPETAGLSSRYLRYIIQLCSEALKGFPDWLPESVKKNQRLIDLKAALKNIHFPLSTALLQKAKQRLAFDEIFLIQLFSLNQKINWSKQKAQAIEFDESLAKKFVSALPFRLTDAQRRASWEILLDMKKTQPMNRLLQGDVGSGKTAVAAMAALETIKAGWQVALMAPTEILAQQHFANISKTLARFKIKIGLLTAGNCKTNSGNITKNELLKKIKRNEVDLIVGTHSLIQKKVIFNKLVLAVVDEQHRFGVSQRAALQKEIASLNDGLAGKTPHLLSMTATPIPRSLALALYGDLEISVLDEMPEGRQSVITKIIPPASRQKAYEFLHQEIKSGRQIFVICPRIEIPEEKNLSKEGQLKIISQAEIRAVKKEYENLSKNIFPEFSVAMLHGKLKAAQKEKIMADFSSGQSDILVSTSVIEVGIDIPNATVMVIEGAERFGLAQLHQFRGRVGRGQYQSYCLLFTEDPSRQTSARLKAIMEAKNGFELAEKDLALRGPGDFLGTRQWGFPDLTMASLTDIILIKACRNEAAALLQQDPTLQSHPLVKKELAKFKATAHFE